MKKTFLEYYQTNLEHLRELGSEFAQDFPKIASRLELSANECPDPYVERLLEGAAFLAARVEKKFDDGNPRLLESVLASAAPRLLAPLPSHCVLELQEPDFGQGCLLPAGSLFQANIPGIQTPCTFSTLWDVPLFNITLGSAKYLTLELGSYGLTGESGLYLEFDVHPQNFSPDTPDGLLLHLNVNDAEASEIQRLLQIDLTGCHVRQGASWQKCADVSFGIPDLDDTTLSPQKQHSQLEGVEQLYRFMAFPAGQKFVLLKNFSRLLQRAENGKLQLVFTFRRRNTELVHLLKNDTFRLNCVPAVNLFAKRSERTSFSLRHEFQVVPDRTAPLDYEIMQVNRVELFDANNRNVQNVRNLYENCEDFTDCSDREYFAAHRRERLLGDNRHSRSSYHGSEVFLSFSGEMIRQYQNQPMQFQADLLCSNRDLPLLLRGDAVLTAVLPKTVRKARFAVPPGNPAPPLIADGSREAWEKTGCLTLHFSTMLWQSDIMPLKILKELIRNYSPRNTEETEKLLDGITELQSAPEVFRFIRKGCIFFENGWKLRLTLDETCCVGTGFYIFACVLRKLLESYAPLNTPVRLELFTKQQGRITEWTM